MPTHASSFTSASTTEKAILAETRIQEAKKSMIKIVMDDGDRIIGCVAPKGTLDPARRDQLFTDANANGALTAFKFLVTGSSDVSGFKTMLGQNPHIRKAMAAVVDSSTACK